MYRPVRPVVLEYPERDHEYRNAKARGAYLPAYIAPRMRCAGVDTGLELAQEQDGNRVRRLWAVATKGDKGAKAPGKSPRTAKK
jgi:hypothetical protein